SIASRNGGLPFAPGRATPLLLWGTWLARPPLSASGRCRLCARPAAPSSVATSMGSSPLLSPIASLLDFERCGVGGPRGSSGWGVVSPYGIFGKKCGRRDQPRVCWRRWCRIPIKLGSADSPHFVELFEPKLILFGRVVVKIKIFPYI